MLVQFKSQSLLRHLRDGWQFGGLLKDEFIIPVPAQMRSADETWYSGTADAIYQNLNLIEDLDGHLVAIFGADDIYRMNVRDMIDFHKRMHADVSVAAIPVSAHLASEFGLLRPHRMARLWHFTKKTPKHLRFGASHIGFMHRWATTFSPLGFCCGNWRPTLCDKTVSTILAVTFCPHCLEE